MALLIPFDLTVEVESKIAPEAAWFCSNGVVRMDKLREFLGGWVELVTFAEPVEVYGVKYRYLACNEEGKLMNLPVNGQACGVMIAAGCRDMIVGNAVLLTEKEMN